MSVFRSIFGKNRLGKGSPRPPALRGATLGKIWQKIGLPVTGVCPGRSVWRTFISAAPRALSPRRWETPSGMSPQTGRSMIEMLAVLAIIGILSVVAVAGLMWAFAKHKANDTIHDVHIWQLAALDSNQLFDMTSGQLILPELGSVSTHGYPMAIWIESEDAFSVHVNDVPKRVCSLMLDMVTADQIVTVNDVLFESADICDAETNLMIFYLSKDQGAIDQACIPACSGTERCCGGVCKELITPCGSDGCTDCGSDYCTTSNTCCSTPTATKCGTTDCCEGNCCNNVCCPSDQVCGSDGNCACQNNLVMNPTTGLCECPSDAPYYFEDANLCCQSGYTPVDGVCQKIDCRGGPTNYNCYINDKQCGYNCDSLGRNCAAGICHADECASDEPFVLIPLDGRQYFYACRRSADDITCYRYGRNAGYFCAKDGEACMYVNASFVQTGGTCDSQVCTNILSSAGLTYWGWYNNGGSKNTSYGSCDFGDNLICVPVNNYATWDCFKNGYRCGSGCTDPLDCGACSTAYCMNGMTYNAQTGYCEDLNTVIYCTTTTGDYYQSCYQKNGEICETVRSQTGTVYRGSCTDPGCPDGMIYGYVSSGERAYGCVDENIGNQGMACYFNAGYSPNICYYNGSLCGRRCDYDGTNCGEVYLPQCALAGHCPQTGYAMTDGCTCAGDVTNVSGTDYCCPTGHTYTNGRCAIN